MAAPERGLAAGSAVGGPGLQPRVRGKVAPVGTAAGPEGGRGTAGAVSSSGRVAALTGLRGLAASSVVLYHIWLYGSTTGASFPAGPFLRVFVHLEIGQTFFFVLSGYLLYRPFGRALLTGGPLPKLSHFAIARVLRIVPAYWAILLIVIALTERRFFSHPLQLLANMFFLEYCFPSLLPPDIGKANGGIAIVPAWSLVVEAGFYIVLPIACALGIRYMLRRRPGLVAAFLPVVPLMAIGAVSTVIEHMVSGDVARDWSANFPIHAGWFGCGMAGTVVGLLWEHGRLRLGRPIIASIAIAALGVIAISFKLDSTNTLSPLDYQWPVAAGISAILLLVVVHADGPLARKALGSPFMVGLGLASYSIFLVHDPIIRAVRGEHWFAATPSGFAFTIAVVGSATALATFLSYQVLEKPSFAARRRLIAAHERRRERLRQPPEARVPEPIVEPELGKSAVRG
jgi:peptidoglycan/LPS O-acetylase OafA/YrhL